MGIRFMRIAYQFIDLVSEYASFDNSLFLRFHCIETLFKDRHNIYT